MSTRSNVQIASTGATIAPSLTLAAYTPTAGSNRVVEVQLAYGRSVAAAISDVTAGGVSLGAPRVVTNEGFQTYVAIYTLMEADLPAAPFDVVATMDGSGGIAMAVSTIDGVDQTTPMDVTPVSANNIQTATPAVAITPVTDGALISALLAGSDARTVSSYNTGFENVYAHTVPIEISSVDLGQVIGFQHPAVTPAALASAGVTLNNSHARDALVAVAYRPVSAAPAPTISSIDPVTGAPAGGTPCTITGTGFVDGATVTFDGVAATGVTWVSATRIDCISPAHAAGAVDVVVTNPDTQTGTLAGGFTYAAVTLASFTVTEESSAALGDFRVGTAKNVLIQAIGTDGQLFTSFTGTVEVSASGSNISAGSGTTAAFVAGELVHAVTFDQLATAITLNVADTATGTDTGTSAAFDVVLPAASAGGSALIGGPSPLIG